MLEVRNISIARGGKTILNDVSLELQRGQVSSMVGPNGAGKSTLLNIISGEIKPDGGTIKVEGKPLESWPVGDLSRCRAVLPQGSELNFPFRVLEVVLLGRTPHMDGLESQEDLEIADSALECVGMSAFKDQIYTTLSGGEKRRVQIARVLAQIWHPRPGHDRLLLMDEPTAGLDLAHRFSSLQTARKLAEAGVAVLVILHDLNLAATYSDQIIVLNNGKVTASGVPSEVLTPALIGEVFDVEADIVQIPEKDASVIVARSKNHG